MSAFEPLDLPFADLLRSVDAVLTKPGCNCCEAACNGTPVRFTYAATTGPSRTA